MGFICLDHKVEDKWEDLRLPLKRTKKELYLQGLQIKVIYLYVIGQLVLQIKQVVKTRLLLRSGINKEVIDLV
mgnify:CR=1 FL=1